MAAGFFRMAIETYVSGELERRTDELEALLSQAVAMQRFDKIDSLCIVTDRDFNQSVVSLL